MPSLAILNSYSHSRMFLQVGIQEVGLLALARNLADYVGYFILLTTRDVKPSPNLYSQALMVSSVLGFLHLGSLMISCLNFAMSCLPHARHLFQLILDTALLAPPQVTPLLTRSNQMSTLIPYSKGTKSFSGIGASIMLVDTMDFDVVLVCAKKS